MKKCEEKNAIKYEEKNAAKCQNCNKKIRQSKGMIVIYAHNVSRNIRKKILFYVKIIIKK